MNLPPSESPSPRFPGADQAGVRLRPRVKICGVKTVEEARLAVELGAELVGLNCHPPSPRYLEPERAADIVAALRQDRALQPITAVGVFVDLPVAAAVEIGVRAGLDVLQFHGDESPEEISPVAQKAIKAFRVKDRLDGKSLDRWLGLGLWGILVDSRHPTLAGGSGQGWDVASLRDLPQQVATRLSTHRLMVAGGIRPDNVVAVAKAARPWGLDLCSGVESRPGQKDPEQMRRLFEEMRDGEINSPA